MIHPSICKTVCSIFEFRKGMEHVDSENESLSQMILGNADGSFARLNLLEVDEVLGWAKHDLDASIHLYFMSAFVYAGCIWEIFPFTIEIICLIKKFISLLVRVSGFLIFNFINNFIFLCYTRNTLLFNTTF